MKKDIVKVYRFDIKTANTIKKRAETAGVSESEFVRRLINSDLEPIEKDTLQSMQRQLAGMANNINQIAHRMNMEIFDKCDMELIEEYKTAMMELKMEISKLRKKYEV